MSSSLRAELALDALEIAIWTRWAKVLDGLVHHSDRSVQDLAIRYIERLADAGAVRSVGSRGDSNGNALAESVVGLFKTELIRMKGPWRTLEHVGASRGRVDGPYNNRRLYSSIGDLPPADYEAAYHAGREEAGVA